MKLPPEKRKDALIEAAANVGSTFLLGMLGEGKRSEAPPKIPVEWREIQRPESGTGTPLWPLRLLRPDLTQIFRIIRVLGLGKNSPALKNRRHWTLTHSETTEYCALINQAEFLFQGTAEQERCHASSERGASRPCHSKIKRRA